MTVPATPPVEPAAPATEPDPQAPAAAAPATPAPPAAPNGLPDDPDALKAEIARLRKENGAERTNAKAQAAEEARNALAQSIGKAIGLIGETPDPAKLTEQLTAQTAQARQAQVELAVFRAAQGVADPAALLDSRSFLTKIADIDPADHLAVAAAIGEAITENPSLVKTDRRLPAPNPALGSSGAGAPDLEAQIAAAQKAGDFRTVIALQNQKLTAPQR